MKPWAIPDVMWKVYSEANLKYDAFNIYIQVWS